MCDNIGMDEFYSENREAAFWAPLRLNQNNETKKDLMLAIRKVVQDHDGSCERLLSSTHSTLRSRRKKWHLSNTTWVRWGKDLTAYFQN